MDHWFNAQVRMSPLRTYKAEEADVIYVAACLPLHDLKLQVRRVIRLNILPAVLGFMPIGALDIESAHLPCFRFDRRWMLLHLVRSDD